VCKGERGKERRQRRERTFQTKTRGANNAYKTSPDKREAFVKKKGKAARRRGFKARLSDIGVIRTHINFTSAWMTLDDRSNNKWLCVEPRTGNYYPTKTKCWRDGKKILKNTWRIGATNTSSRFERWWSWHWFAEPWRNKKALKYLKNSKAAGADSIVAELLKNGEPNLVDAVHAVIQQAWISATLPRNWTEGVLCPVYKKANKVDYKKYWGICLFSEECCNNLNWSGIGSM
jgi:hypothetical protein